MSNLLKEYVLGYLKESAINYDDHNKIEQTIKIIDGNLKSYGMSIYTLDFNPHVIAFLRDTKPIKNRNLKAADFPQTYLDNQWRQKSQDLNMFKGFDLKLRELPGLGFNIVDILKSDNSFYTTKIEQLINVYKAYEADGQKDPFGVLDISEGIKLMENVLNLKEALINSGVNILGAGVFRVVVEIPDVKDVAIKIALSSGGRKDCKHEIEFSMGRNTARQSHTENFPKIFSYDETDQGAWYAIEKVLFLNKSTFMRQDVMSDFQEQFKNTLDLFAKGGFLKYLDPPEILRMYINLMFRFSSTELADARNKVFENIEKKKEDDKKLINKVVSAIKGLFKMAKSDSKHHEVTAMNNVFKDKLFYFMYAVSALIYDRHFLDKDKVEEFKRFLESIKDLDPSDLQSVSQDMRNMYDQAVITDIKDTHIGNIGFRKNDEGKWRLVFTDIDSGQ